MNSAAAQRELFMPQPPGGLGRGLVLALLVHGLLLAGLAVGVNWRSSNPQGIQAELWAAVPQVAAPRAAAPEEAPPPKPRPEPPPAPRPVPVERAAAPPPAPRPDPQIAIEQERQKREAARQLELAEQAAQAEKARRAEAERVERRRQEQLAEAEREKQRQKDREQAEELARQKELAAKAKAEARRIAEAREAAIRRMTAQAGGSTGEPGSTGTADRNAAPSAGYTGRVIARIKPNIVFVDTLADNPAAEVLVRLAPDGRIISQKLVRSSGSREWDQAVQRAIERTEVLPRDVDGRVPPSMSITFRPRE